MKKIDNERANRKKACAPKVAYSKSAVRLVLKTSFPLFCRYAYEAMNTGEKLSKDPYLDVLWASLEDVFSGKVKRLIINLPPRHLKTFLATVCLAAWELAHRPSSRVMIICYGENLAESIAYKVREIIRSEWFRETFDCRIARDRDRVAEFETTHGGGLIARSIDGAIPGYGANIIILDDPNDIADARSPRRLQEINDIFDTTILSRLNDPAHDRIVVVQQRIAAGDLSGHLLEQRIWEHLKLPLVAEKAETYRYGRNVWHRKKGELLRPEAFPPAHVEQLRKTSGLPDFQTLYQQSPSERYGLLEENDFLLLDKRPYYPSGIVLSVDTAQGVGDRNSFSVIQAWQRVLDGHYLVDQWREQASYDVLVKKVRSFVRRYNPGVILIENTGVGAALISQVERGVKRAGIAVVAALPGHKDKVERLAEVINIVKNKCVRLPADADWTATFLEEVTSFPYCGSNDQVDAMTQYLAWTLKNGNVPARPPRCHGVVVNRYGNLSSNRGIGIMPTGQLRDPFKQGFWLGPGNRR